MIIPILENYINVANKEERSYELHFDYPMTECASFRVGGVAKAVVFPLSVASFLKLLTFLSGRNINFLVLGNGTNVIPSDNGFDGVLIVTKKISEFCIEGNKIYAGCGVSLSKLSIVAADVALSGMENLYGIPATIGGAVYMNAGAYGTQISDILLSAECYDLERGELVVYTNDEMNMSYRHSRCRDEKLVLLSATFQLSFGNEEEIKDRMKEVMSKRKSAQPLEYPNAGSIFKRPKDNFAGKLIEDAGLKGTCVGGAEVSVKHAGFIINKGGATSSDIASLIDIVKARVFETSGVMLECEVEFLKETE